MDAFEQVIAQILERQGFWTQLNTRVELTAADKQAIGRPSSPRWELDVLGYRPASNELLVLECKSYLDSPGVRVTAFDGTDQKAAGRYKLFTEPKLREVVIARLVEQLVSRGFCAPAPTIRLCLAAGRVHGDEDRLVAHFKANGWTLWTPAFIRGELEALSESGYENTVAAVVVKLLLRGAAD